MQGDDDNKTVFGQPLPPRPGQKPGSGDGADRTVFGQKLQGTGRVAPTSPHPLPTQARPAFPEHNLPTPSYPSSNPDTDDTWLSGALNPVPWQRDYPPTPPVNPSPAQGPSDMPPPLGDPGLQRPGGFQGQPLQPIYRPGTGQRPAGSEFFPEIPTDPMPETRQSVARISLSDALKANGIGAGGATNPLIASAANLLILLGRLRTGLVEMQAAPLIDHVTREIDMFERNALAAGVKPHDAREAKYALSATADDIVQNLPGVDRGMWLEYSMVARFFGERSSGVVFFQKMDDAMRAPGQTFNLLELMLTCLSLGFEGQYRAIANGSVELARIRTTIYETLRRVQPRPDDDISVQWAAVPMGGRRRQRGVPVWVIGAIAAFMVMSLFATLSTLLSRQGGDVRDRIASIHRELPEITIERTELVGVAYVAPDSGQLERIRAALSEQITAGAVEVERTNEWVFVRVGEALRFAPASAELRSDIAALAAVIGKTLDRETGPIRVVGHTDSDRMSGRGRYKTNEDLSLARAQTVADILSPSVTDPARLAVEGLGAMDPIAENDTSEGKARNRRVEIMIPREN